MGRNGQEAAVQLVAYAALDPTSATAITTGITLPTGAIINRFEFNALATGGTNPTIGVGTAANNDGFIDVLPADGGITVPEVRPGLATYAGALLLTPALTADTELFVIGGDTGTDATGGLVHMWVYYHMDQSVVLDASGE